ncbi:MAG TPA: glycogen/starch synthase [Candidatus Krumholzibacteriaceae bacterium]|nr:glycogen/starch synthase [Candidatus Krumholzibacteriaceae bacterium]
MKPENLNIAIISSEIVPFSKVGGLADVIGALPDEIARKGCEITIFTPLYKSIRKNDFNIKKESINVPAVKVDGKEKRVQIFSAKKPGTDIKVYFIYNEQYYDRDGIYTVPETGEAFEDEDERTIFFNRAVIAAVKKLDIYPDVVHANDFHCGLIAPLISLEESQDKHFEKTGTVFSIHNLAYQGNYKADFIRKAGLDSDLFYPMGPFEYYGGVNVMKAGIIYSDIISTVSKKYAEEITLSKKYGHGMEKILWERRDDIIGILNGIDTDIWNPGTDELIECNYSADNLSGKAKNRKALLEEFDLTEDRGAPVIGIVSRLVDQKGFDILAEAMDEIMKMNLKLVILGTGQEKYHKLYSKMKKKYSSKLGLKLEYNNRLAHLTEAGSDYFLMPSRYEPCGLNQLYSLRYGSIPIVRATGGLKDTINNLSSYGEKGNGFVFEDYSAFELTKVIREAVDFFRDGEKVMAVRKRIMMEDHSWEKSAKKYISMYKKTAGGSKNEVDKAVK